MGLQARVAAAVRQAQEAERQRIALELHDSTVQHIVALEMGVSRLRRMLGSGDKAREVLEDMTRSAQEAMKEVRVLSYLMKSPVREDEALGRYLERYLRGFAMRTGLAASFRSEGPVELARLETRHAVCRIVQAALSNVYRHARATSVEVELTHRDGRLTLRIRDDGKGLCVGECADDLAIGGVGLAGMRERATQLGGRLLIASGPGGTLVTAVLPAPRAQRIRQPATARRSGPSLISDNLP
jgi:signal transduction histidine kinase